MHSDELRRFDTISLGAPEPTDPFMTPSPEKPLPATPKDSEPTTTRSTNRKTGDTSRVTQYVCQPLNKLGVAIGGKFETDPVKAADKARKKGERVQRSEAKKEVRRAKKDAKRVNKENRRANRGFNGVSWGYDAAAGLRSRASGFAESLRSGRSGKKAGNTNTRAAEEHIELRESVRGLFAAQNAPENITTSTADLEHTQSRPKERKSRMSEMLPSVDSLESVKEPLPVSLPARGNTWGVSRGVPGAGPSGAR